MKNTVLTISCIFLTTSLLFAQSITKSNKLTEESIVALNETASSDRLPVCLPPGCRCEGGITEMQLYYLGTNNVNIEVFRDQIYTNLITTISNVTAGDLLTVSALNSSSGQFAYYTYFRVTDITTGEVCSNRIYTQCPRNAWPGALSDLQILGKRFGDLFVYGYTSSAENQQCDIGDIEQYWKVGGNIVAPDNMTFGTLNNEAVSIITNNLERGIITNDGDFGLGNSTPMAKLDVSGDAIISQTLDVGGITRLNDNTQSNTSADGALIVTGGAGIGGNLNAGQNLSVGNNANITQNATVGQNLTVGSNAGVGANLTVTGTGNIGNNLTVRNDAIIQNNGHIAGVLNVGTTNTPGSFGSINTSGYHLFVSGGILTEEVLVRTGWADYVFEKEYRLRSLEEVEKHIEQHGYLPEMPSAAAIEAGGLPLGANAVNQQVKIEELFLYIIEINKQIELLKTENEQLKKHIAKLSSAKFRNK